jgi:hypothetical protein
VKKEYGESVLYGILEELEKLRQYEMIERRSKIIRHSFDSFFFCWSFLNFEEMGEEVEC